MADQEKNEKQIRREKKNEAFKALKEFFDKTPNEKCVEALKVIRPSLYGMGGSGRTGGSPAYLKIVNKIIESGNAGTNEMVLFKEFKIGRKETNGMIKRYLRNVEPKNRVWINFTPSDGNYKVIGKGEKAPENYTGYIPVDEVTDLK